MSDKLLDWLRSHPPGTLREERDVRRYPHDVWCVRVMFGWRYRPAALHVCKYVGRGARGDGYDECNNGGPWSKWVPVAEDSVVYGPLYTLFVLQGLVAYDDMMMTAEQMIAVVDSVDASSEEHTQ